MLDYRDISLMESVPLMWGPVTASPVGIEPMTIFGGGAPYVRHLEAISQAKRLWINTNQKAAKQTIGAKWTQLIPPASGCNRLSRQTCR